MLVVLSHGVAAVWFATAKFIATVGLHHDSELLWLCRIVRNWGHVASALDFRNRVATRKLLDFVTLRHERLSPRDSGAFRMVECRVKMSQDCLEDRTSMCRVVSGHLAQFHYCRISRSSASFAYI